MTRHLHGCGHAHDCEARDPLQPTLPGQESYPDRWRAAPKTPRAMSLAGSVVRNWTATGEGFLPGLVERIAAALTVVSALSLDDAPDPADPVAPGWLLRALEQGRGTHDCPACDNTGVLRYDRRTCPLCAGWGSL